MKTKFLQLTAISAVLFSTSALALPQIGFNFAGTGLAGMEYADTWNYAADRAVDVGNQDFISPPGPVGDKHEFHSQSVVNSFQKDGVTFNPGGGFNGGTVGYQITKEWTLQDTVLDFTPNGLGGGTVIFGDTGTDSGILNIYIDYYNAVDASKADGGSGAGKVACYGTSQCGVATDRTGAFGAELGPILTAHAVRTTSSFTASVPGTGTGSFQIAWMIDFVNTDYIDIDKDRIFLDIMDGTLTQPSSQLPQQMWDGTTPGSPNSGLFDVSGRQIFVPEPSTIALLGAGLLFSGLSRKKKA